MKNTLDEMKSETITNATAEFLEILDFAIAGLSEIKPLDETLLDRIDRLTEKAAELRGEQNEN